MKAGLAVDRKSVGQALTDGNNERRAGKVEETGEEECFESQKKQVLKELCRFAKSCRKHGLEIAIVGIETHCQTLIYEYLPFEKCRGGHVLREEPQLSGGRNSEEILKTHGNLLFMDGQQEVIVEWRVVGAGQEQGSSTELCEDNGIDWGPCCVFEK